MQHRRDRGDDRSADRLPLPLIIEKEERAVAVHRTAEHAAKLVPPKLRLHRIGRGEEIARVQRLMSKELEDRSAKLVGAGFRRQVDDTPIESAELRRRTVALDLEVLNRIDVGKKRDLAGLRLKHGNAVEEILLVRGRPPFIRGSGGRWWWWQRRRPEPDLPR